MEYSFVIRLFIHIIKHSLIRQFLTQYMIGVNKIFIRLFCKIYPICSQLITIYLSYLMSSRCGNYSPHLLDSRPCMTLSKGNKVEYQDNTDKIEVERTFSVAKRCCGMWLITNLKET